MVSSSACRGHRLQVEDGVTHLVVILDPVAVEHLIATTKDQAGFSVDQESYKAIWRQKKLRPSKLLYSRTLL